jgi:hypothetical protein
MPEYVKVQIYEPTYTDIKLVKVHPTKWDLLKFIFNGIITTNGEIIHKNEIYKLYKMDKDSAIQIAHVKKEED